jgi:hypothetical protein
MLLDGVVLLLLLVGGESWQVGMGLGGGLWLLGDGMGGGGLGEEEWLVGLRG